MQIEEWLVGVCKKIGPMKTAGIHKRIPFYLLKLVNKKQYCHLKHELEQELSIQYLKRFWNKWERYTRKTYRPIDAYYSNIRSFKHSGNAGDIIYSLPSIKAIADSSPANLKLALDIPMKGPNAKNHPLGGVMLNKTMFDMLKSLLESQSYISKVEIYDGGAVDCDLDAFRESPIMTDRMNIAQWYSHFLFAFVDSEKPWIDVVKNDDYKNHIIISRSERYRNHDLDFSILKKYKNIVFVGVEKEYADAKKMLPHLEWLQVTNFMEMAEAIAGCRLFVGNQSFPFSLAEALKVPRLLEVDPTTPNVVPAGGIARRILFQKEFDFWLDRLLVRPLRYP